MAGLFARLSAVFATSFFLIATSYEPEPDQVCNHPTQQFTFRVAGTCGAAGEIVVVSVENECAITVQGSNGVGLPSAGRFGVVSNGKVDLLMTPWSLSGYLPERTAPTVGKSDAGAFAIERDALATPSLRDAGGFTVEKDAGAPAAPADGGTFVAGRDGGSSIDLGTQPGGPIMTVEPATPSGSPPDHGLPTKRTCNVEWQKAGSASFKCSDSNASITTCQGTLTR